MFKSLFLAVLLVLSFVNVAFSATDMQIVNAGVKVDKALTRLEKATLALSRAKERHTKAVANLATAKDNFKKIVGVDWTTPVDPERILEPNQAQEWTDAEVSPAIDQQ